MALSCIFRFLRWAIFLALAIAVIQYWLTNKKYIFTEEAVAAIAKKHVGADAGEAYRKIHKDLQRKYPGHILPQLEWVFINAGGYMGGASWAHASLTEYIAFFGSGIGGKGHSGRHWANITNTIIKGKIHGWSAGSFKLHSFKAGDVVRLPWGQAEAMDIEPDTWTVEYGRGFIPATMGWASADTIFSTLDFVTLFNTVRIYYKGLWMEFCFSLGQANDYVKGLLT